MRIFRDPCSDQKNHYVHNNRVYNLSNYDVAIILTDSSCVPDKSVKSICGAIHESGCKRIIIGKE